VDSAKTQATLAEGVLTVRIAKTEEVKPRQIAVRAE
jgi:HSP20 family molecular chaperone IbpA